MIVIDASAMVAWLLNEPGKMSIRELNDVLPHHEIIVPAHWISEVGNALITNRKRGRLSADRFAAILDDIFSFEITAQSPLGSDEFKAIALLALENQLTFYDAAYVKLAIDTQAALATLDEAMRRIAARHKVALVPQ